MSAIGLCRAVGGLEVRSIGGKLSIDTGDRGGTSEASIIEACFRRPSTAAAFVGTRGDTIHTRGTSHRSSGVRNGERRGIAVFGTRDRRAGPGVSSIVTGERGRRSDIVPGCCAAGVASLILGLGCTISNSHRCRWDIRTTAGSRRESWWCQGTIVTRRCVMRVTGRDEIVRIERVGTNVIVEQWVVATTADSGVSSASRGGHGTRCST